MRNVSWASYIRDKRKSRGMTRKRLADLSDIDPSYVTLMERDGYVPRKDKVVALVNALDADVDEALLLAGYAPQDMPVAELIDKIETVKTDLLLESDLKMCIRELFALSASQQRKVAELLTSYIKTLKERDQERASSRWARRTRAMGG